ncbi:MAG: TetR/AcrR family transcriptional regulator [Actinobacteria bacterium]|nr:TetR/AcrR family transcriptional regulator [Actinomycetota bacterium]
MIESVPGQSRGGSDQRRRIVAAMVASCAERTYAATTIGDLVSRAHISRTTFYREFDDKLACFEAALDYCIEELRIAAVTACAASEPGTAALRNATSAVLEALAERPQLAHLLVGEAVAVEPAVIERYRDLVVPAVAALWEDEQGPTRLDPWLAFGRAQLLILDRVTAGGAARLPELLPEIVYLAVAPFAGHDAAIEEARACLEPLAGAAG